VAEFHGGLTAPKRDMKNIKAKILSCMALKTPYQGGRDYAFQDGTYRPGPTGRWFTTAAVHSR
jgi:hypothetical protein